jgi:hypothetical protein
LTSSGGTVGITSTFGDVSDVTDNHDGTYTATVAALADSTQTATVSFDLDGTPGTNTATIRFIDGVAPNPPTVDPTNGKQVSGTAEPGSTVTVYGTDGTGHGQGVTDPNGNYVVKPISPAPKDGDQLNVTATDAAGNESDPTPTTVHTTPPKPPTVDPTNGTQVTGASDPGTKVTVYDAQGHPLGSTTTDANGRYTVRPLTPKPIDGQVLKVTATDIYGNESDPTTVIVDANPPAPPKVNPTDGALVTGTAEPGSTVKIWTNEDAPKLLGQGVAAADGSFSIAPLTPRPAIGDIILVTATDAADNTSAPTAVVVGLADANGITNPTGGASVQPVTPSGNGGGLPYTGAVVAPVSVLAGLLLTAGLVMLMASARRRRPELEGSEF